MVIEFHKKNISNLEDLSDEQDRVKDRYEELGKEITDSLFSPFNIGSFVFSQIISRKKKKKQRKFRYGKKDITELKLQSTISQKTPFLKRKGTRNILKAIGKSFLQWQLFNLSLYAGKKIIEKIKNKKQSK